MAGERTLAANLSGLLQMVKRRETVGAARFSRVIILDSHFGSTRFGGLFLHFDRVRFLVDLGRRLCIT